MTPIQALSLVYRRKTRPRDTGIHRGLAGFPYGGCSDFVPLASCNSSPRTLAEYCPALRSLRVRHCHRVAEPSLSRLRKRGVDIDVEPRLHQALVLLQDMAGFAPFVNLQV